MKVRVHLFVSGKVQGVFFRFETQRVAKAHRVYGWVRNLQDTRVEVLLEGEKKDVEKVVEFCRRGPPGAIVTNIEVEWEKWKGEFKDFTVTFQMA